MPPGFMVPYHIFVPPLTRIRLGNKTVPSFARILLINKKFRARRNF